MNTLTDDPVKQPPRPKLLQVMGPGLITGASDDDPSGIATYSQVGAQFGYGLAWTLLFSYPLMAAIQEISARIGRVTGSGIAGNLREHYPRWLSTSVVDVVMTYGSTRNDKATVMRRIQPHTARPDAVSAGLCDSTCSV